MESEYASEQSEFEHDLAYRGAVRRQSIPGTQRHDIA